MGPAPPRREELATATLDHPFVSRVEGTRMCARSRVILYVVPEDWYFVTHRLALARAAVQTGYRVVVATRVGDAASEIDRAGCDVGPLRGQRNARQPWNEAAVIIEPAPLVSRVLPEILYYEAT